jgi:hypothetical protein
MGAVGRGAEVSFCDGTFHVFMKLSDVVKKDVETFEVVSTLDPGESPG